MIPLRRMGAFGGQVTSPALVAVVAAVAAVGVGAGPVAASPSASGPWVLKVRSSDSVVAGLSTAGAPRLQRVIEAWGSPTRLAEPGWSAGSGNGCVAIWTRPAARLEFVNYGGRPAGATACDPRYGFLQEVLTLGPRWRTDRSLRVGGGPASVVRAFPRAVRSKWGGRPAWLLLPKKVTCIGDCPSATTTTSEVIALANAEGVRQFLVNVGAGGD